MKKNLRGKRPCCICRKWFQPDVRQIGRQKTCANPDCKNEHHRRLCEKWNKTNKEYFKTNYLDKKLEVLEDKQPEPCKTQTVSPKQLLSLKSSAKPVVPCEIIAKEYGIKNLIIIQYLAYQIMNQTHGRVTRSFEKMLI